MVCEDWFHSRHLGVANPPSGSAYAEMVCKGCVEKHSLLSKYANLAVGQGDKKVDKEAVEVSSFYSCKRKK